MKTLSENQLTEDCIHASVSASYHKASRRLPFLTGSMLLKRLLFPDSRLSIEEQVLAAKFERLLNGDFERYFGYYKQRFGRLVNTDSAKELCLEYSRSPETRARYSSCAYEPAKRFVRRVFEKQMGESEVSRVVFLAGGSASGKSVFQAMLADQENSTDTVVVDGTLSDHADASTQIRLAIACDKEVKVIYVYCPADLAARRALNRSFKSGRTICLDTLAQTHFASQKTVLRLAHEFNFDSDFGVLVIDNSGHDPVVGTLEYLRDREYRTLDDVIKSVKDAFEDECHAHEKEFGTGVPAWIKEAFLKEGRKVA